MSQELSYVAGSSVIVEPIQAPQVDRQDIFISQSEIYGGITESTQMPISPIDQVWQIYGNERESYVRWVSKYRVADAEGIVQDAFLKAAENINKFRYGADVTKWLRAIVVRKTLDAKRDESTANRRIGLQVVYEDRDAVEHVPANSNEAPDNDNRLLQQELYNAISKLSFSYRQVIEMSLSGYSNKEIAEEMGLTDQAVRLRRHRGYSALRKSHPHLREYLQK